jgi:hydroxypyruvate isomerase
MTCDPQSSIMSRRDVMTVAGTAAAAALLGPALPVSAQARERAVTKGRIKQSACKWCYGKIPLKEFCQAAKEIGLVGIDLLGPGDFATLKEYGLVCTMTSSHGINPGLNRKQHHERCLDAIRKAIEATSAAGFRNVICFSGNRDGMDDDEGARNCADALKQVARLAEEKNVIISMELLNSKRNHKDYMCDRTEWGVKMCKMVGSPNVKLLYDIYHMQIMEGDIIATIKENREYIGHIHTGGVPGRNEIDETQEIYHPPIMQALLDIKFDGFVAHEFIPRRDPLTSLAQAVKLCDI